MYIQIWHCFSNICSFYTSCVFDVELRNLWLNDKEGNNLLFLACWGILQSRWVRKTRSVGCDLLPVEQLWIVQPVIMRCCKQLLLSLWHHSQFKRKVLTKLRNKQSNYFYVIKKYDCYYVFIKLVRKCIHLLKGHVYIYMHFIHVCEMYISIEFLKYVYMYTLCHISLFNLSTCPDKAAILYHPDKPFLYNYYL